MWVRRSTARLSIALAAVFAGLVLVDPAASVAASSAPTPAAPAQTPARGTENRLLAAPPGAMSEATAAVDPYNPAHMAVAANPYLDPVRIQVSITDDGGRHWSPALTVLPPGAYKSYDPQLGYAPDGSLLVTGGSTADTRGGCQGGGQVFLAELRGGAFTFHTLAVAAPANALLDRPTLLATAATPNVILVAWTASSGPGAECALRPVRSSTRVARLTAQLRVLGTVTLPRVAQAPFGSQLAVSGAGVYGLVVAGRDASDGITVAVYTSTNGVSWLAETAGSARAAPDELPGLGGAVLSMPTIAGLPRGFAVAWTDAAGGIERTRLARDDTGRWQEVAAPPAAGPVLLPTVAAAGHDLVVIQAGLGPAGLTFSTWQQQATGWVPLAVDAGGSGAELHELGEALGLAAGGGGSYLTAVPVELAGGSALLVRTRRPAPPAASPPARSAPALPRANRPHGDRSSGEGSTAVLGTAAGLLALTLAAVWIRRRRGAHR